MYYISVQFVYKGKSHEMVSRNCCGAERIFDSKKAKKQKSSFLKKGAKGSTRKLIHLLSNFAMTDKTLLDVGGGVGAIQWSFLENGGKATTDIDASQAYIRIAREIAEAKNVVDKTAFINSDVTDQDGKIAPHDFVTLDKVVCCYPDYESLLLTATDNCNEVLALSMPISGIISRFFSSIGNFWLYMNKVPFRSYVHSRKTVDNFIQKKGFKLVHNKLSFPWHVLVYLRDKNGSGQSGNIG